MYVQIVDFEISNSKSEVLKSNSSQNNFFLENYVTSEGSVFHNVLYYRPLPITRYQVRFYANNYFEQLSIVSTGFTPYDVYVDSMCDDTHVCGGFCSRTNYGNYLHTFVLGRKKNATHRGRPGEAKRTHPIFIGRHGRVVIIIEN